MAVVNKEIKFSSKIQTDDSFNVFKKYHDLLITEMFYFQQQWLAAAFRRFKDFDNHSSLKKANDELESKMSKEPDISEEDKFEELIDEYCNYYPESKFKN